MWSSTCKTSFCLVQSHATFWLIPISFALSVLFLDSNSLMPLDGGPGGLEIF